MKTNALYLESILQHLDVVSGPNKEGSYIAWCRFHQDGSGNPPHRPNLHVSEKGYICFACGVKGSLSQLAQHVGIDIPQAEDLKAYDYRNEEGRLLFQVVRYRGKRYRQRRPDGQSGWIWNLRGIRRVLYRLPEMLSRPNNPVFIVEGEKDADRLASLGLLATTNPGGAGKWRNSYSEHLSGRDAIIIPDHDNVGRRHANEVANNLLGKAASVKILELPGLNEKGDVSDWIAAGHTIEDLNKITDETAPVRSLTDLPQEPATDAPGKKAVTQAEILVDMVTSGDSILFCDQMGECHVRYSVAGHQEIYPTGSHRFKRYLAHRFYESQEKVPRNEALKSAVNVLEGMTISRGEKHYLYNRVALHDNAIWYDLADSRWRAIKITPDCWRLINKPPILFRRFAHQSPQVEPISGGNLQEIFNFLNINNDAHRVLFLIYLVSSFIPHISHHICVLYGPQGSAKTTAFRILRQLIDPSICEILGFPRDEGQLIQALSHNWAAYFDNLSSLQIWASDALCRAVTGEGYSKRQLYSNDDDFIYSFKCCVGLNGVNIVAKKPDLLDRCLLFSLDPIKSDQRKTEEQIYAEFQKVKPHLLGATFDALSQALAIIGDINLSRFGRMADFNRWGVAIARALGIGEEEFLSAYDDSLREQSLEAIQGNPVAGCILRIVEDDDEWKGSAMELLARINEIADSLKIDKTSRQWPRAANVLTRRINEITLNLLGEGISVVQWRNEMGKQFWISKDSEECQRPLEFPGKIQKS
jgi:hypothetical protein